MSYVVLPDILLSECFCNPQQQQQQHPKKVVNLIDLIDLIDVLNLIDMSFLSLLSLSVLSALLLTIVNYFFSRFQIKVSVYPIKPAWKMPFIVLYSWYLLMFS